MVDSWLRCICNVPISPVSKTLYLMNALRSGIIALQLLTSLSKSSQHWVIECFCTVIKLILIKCDTPVTRVVYIIFKLQKALVAVKQNCCLLLPIPGVVGNDLLINFCWSI